MLQDTDNAEYFFSFIFLHLEEIHLDQVQPTRAETPSWVLICNCSSYGCTLGTSLCSISENACCHTTAYTELSKLHAAAKVFISCCSTRKPYL